MTPIAITGLFFVAVFGVILTHPAKPITYKHDFILTPGDHKKCWICGHEEMFYLHYREQDENKQ